MTRPRWRQLCNYRKKKPLTSKKTSGTLKYIKKDYETKNVYRRAQKNWIRIPILVWEPATSSHRYIWYNAKHYKYHSFLSCNTALLVGKQKSLTVCCVASFKPISDQLWPLTMSIFVFFSCFSLFQVSSFLFRLPFACIVLLVCFPGKCEERK